MQATNQNNYIISSQLSCVATFHNFYGIGKVKAARLNSFLLNHPTQTVFVKDFDDLLDDEIGANILRNIPLDKTIRLYVANRISSIWPIFSYKSYRLFMDLPLRQGRSHCNAKTSKKRNPFLSLLANRSSYISAKPSYKIYELTLNARYNELDAFKKALSEKESK